MHHVSVHLDPAFEGLDAAQTAELADIVQAAGLLASLSTDGPCNVSELIKAVAGESCRMRDAGRFDMATACDNVAELLERTTHEAIEKYSEG